VTASPASPTTLVLHGSTTLLTDNLSNTTLWVQGSAGGNATLTTADGVTNAGTILLETIDSWWGSRLVGGDFLANTGTIEAAGGGNPTITGDVVNLGTIAVAADSALDINSESPDGPSLTQLGGAIAADGQLLLNGGTFEFAYGTLAGDFVVR